MKNQFNRAYRSVYQQNILTSGLFMPIEAFAKDVPVMDSQIDLAIRAEELGFKALWFRDIPLRDPNFGDVGQIFDPFVYMSYIASKTTEIALATGSMVLPLHHPIDILKAATSVDVLSSGRVILGVAAGDRPLEFPAFNIPYASREERFRDSILYMKSLQSAHFPVIHNPLGVMTNSDMLPKPYENTISIMTTGYAQQSLEWIAKNSDGWINFPRPLLKLQESINLWRKLTNPFGFKPYTQGLMLDLKEDNDAKALPIHLGFSAGKHHLIDYLHQIKRIGVNHIIFYLKLSKRPASEVMEQLGKEVLPYL
ncbi:LLM class oxidoreductase [Sulfuricurvum sp.]|uniref:LLM class oxidoreductase n=1 Tax=Sulfuricurvum sp. TaxID=2025608 RepID=UPI003BAE963D